MIIADGFSSREQIKQLTRQHTAQVLQMVLHESGESDQAAKGYPKKEYVDRMRLNLSVLTVQKTVGLFSMIGLVVIRCLLVTKNE